MFKRFLLVLVVLATVFSAGEALAVEKKITFEWDPNQESYITGYKLYYSINKQGGPYDGPLEVFGKVTTGYTVYDLEPGEVIYFVLTAYTTEIMPSQESGYSNEVFFSLDPSDPGNYPMAKPVFRLKSVENASSTP